MNEGPDDDSAWVRIATDLSPAALIAFCRDGERLLRINPMYEFEEWRSDAGGRPFMRVRNLSNGRMLETFVRIEPKPDGTRLVYESGLKAATEFRVEPKAGDCAAGGAIRGAELIVTDVYSGTPKAEREARIDEIDRSLVWWGQGLKRYLRYHARWSNFGPWAWYMRRVWLPMKPKARNIAFLLIVVTVFELASGILILAAFALGL